MSQTAPSTFLQKAGAVGLAVVKHVPTRAVLWGAIAFFIGLACEVLSTLVLLASSGGGGSHGLAFFAVVPAAILVAGTVVFHAYGARRGAARAAIELEKKFGLVSHLVDRIFGVLQARIGHTIADLPLDQVEADIKSALASIGHSDDEGATGVMAFVIRRSKKAVITRVEKALLSAYRQERSRDGAGGGISLEKLHAEVTADLVTGIEPLLMKPANRQLAVLMSIYVVLAAGWWFWIVLVAALLGTAIR